MKKKEDKVFRILAINPGSTSTKVAVFENEMQIVDEVVRHNKDDLAGFASVIEQKDLRHEIVLGMLSSRGIDISTLDAVVGRGGVIEPIDSGTYLITKRMLQDLINSAAAVHASALGGIIAAEIGREAGIPSYVVDPVVVDELDQHAKLTGLPGVERRSVFHALNQKAIARRCAGEMGTTYENSRFIVAHMGSGITVGAHRYGRVIDVNDALSGEGPFTPERTGGIPALPLIHLCFSGAYTEKELVDIVTKSGGMSAYLNTNDLRKCERLIKEGDEYAALVLESMAYQVSKDIGAMSAALEGRVDTIILTGGLAWSTRFTGSIKQRVGLIAPVKVYPGEDEMRALAEGALRVLRGQEQAIEY
jgi:butyrate kinase